MAVKCIRIKEIPIGDAPEEFKKAWIGFVLPTVSETASEVVCHGVLSKTESHQVKAWSVPAVTAIELLSVTSDFVAVAWWYTVREWKENDLLVFNEECCEMEMVEETVLEEMLARAQSSLAVFFVDE